MTRPDVKQKYLAEFLDWSLTTLSQTGDKSITDIMALDGVLQSLVNTHQNIDHLNTAADVGMFTCTSVYVAAICMFLLLCHNIRSFRFYTKCGFGRSKMFC